MNKLEEKKKQLIDEYIERLHIATVVFIKSINVTMDDSDYSEIIRVGSDLFHQEIEKMTFNISCTMFYKLKID
jgi:hypothetical protein